MNIIRRVAFSSGWLWSLASLFCQGTLFAQFEKLNESWRWAQFSSENGLPSSRVFGIAETPSGKIWATTEFGLAWFDGYCWHAVGKEEGVPGVRARAVVPDAAGQVFVLLDGNLYHGGEHGFRRILLTHKGQTMPVSFFVGLPDHRYLLVSDSSLYAFRNDTVLPYVATPEVSQQRVTGVWATADGGLWINTLNGLFRKVGNEWAVVLPASRRPLAVTRVVAGTDGRAIAYIQAPRIRKGVWEFDLRRRPRHAFADPSEFIQSMDIGPNGDAVLCIETGGLRVRHGSVWNSLVRPPEQMKNVLFVKFRDNGDLWAGSEDALHLYRSSSKRWSFWVHDEVSGRNSTNAILRTRDGSLWLARGIGLEVHKKDNTIQVFERIGNVTLNAVTGLAQDTAGHVWISSGSAFEGAYRWDGVAWKHFGVNEGLVTGYIHKIAIDRKGSPWFLAITKHDFGSRDDGTGPGAFVYSQGAFTKWGTEEGLLSGRVYAFVEGLQGEYWFGTDLGLSRWRSGQWKHWTAAEGLRSARIYTITYDKQNRLWFGNQNNGLGVLENDVPRYFTTADGLVSNAVWDIRTNSDGRLWIATHGGLSSYWEGTWASFGASSGLSYSRLWPVLPEGNKIYVGTVGGGTAILDLEEAGKHDPIVVPTLPVVENGSVLLRWNAYSYFASVGQQDIETRFRIDDGQWSMWSRNREVTVANLALGEHKVTIHAKSEYGTYDSLGRSVSFSIPSPFYRRPLYYLPMSAMFVALIWLALIAAARKRRLDKALVLSEAQHRAVVEDQSEFIMRFLPDGTRTFVNLAYCHEYGKGVAELVGENFFGSLSGEASERVRNKLAGLTPREPVATDEHCSISPNGEIRWHQWTDRAIFNEEGQLVEFQAVGHDITVRKRAENSLRMFQYSIDQASDAVFWMTRDA
ncbi:MAG TPA: hypothetical protein DGH68_11385, partial [Bacteroidetes bacterium]|nr:hypothetical protein [Bacteroidota bacterium]